MSEQNFVPNEEAMGNPNRYMTEGQEQVSKNLEALGKGGYLEVSKVLPGETGGTGGAVTVAFDKYEGVIKGHKVVFTSSERLAGQVDGVEIGVGDAKALYERYRDYVTDGENIDNTVRQELGDLWKKDLL